MAVEVEARELIDLYVTGFGSLMWAIAHRSLALLWAAKKTGQPVVG
jgi:type IV secretory pathway TrbD component